MVWWFLEFTILSAAAFCLASAGTPNQKIPNSRGAPFAQEPSTQSPDSRQQRADSETPAEGETVTLPEGAKIPVRVTDEINSKQGKEGEMFSGSVDPSVLVHDVVVIPRGTEAHMRMTHNKKGGHIHGKAEVTLELVSLILNGRRLEVESNEISKKKGALSAKGAAVAKKSPSGAMVAGEPVGAALPAIAVFTAAKVEVKPGSRLEFILESPFTFEKPPVNPPQQ